MARLRRPEPVVEPVSDAPVVLRRRLRLCGECGERTDWHLMDVGPLCVECLALEGVQPPRALLPRLLR